MKKHRIIRVNVFASSNLEDVRNTVFDLLTQLNHTLKKRGIEFAIYDNSQNSNDELIDIALYWKDFGDLPKEKLESAYESLRAGGPPSKIYVFFRESNEVCGEAMQAFKDSFASKYGHFYCRFENVDSVKFELAVRCLEYLPDQFLTNQDNLLTVKDSGDIQLEGESIANIENLPFAKLNQKRNSLIRRINYSEKEIERLESNLKETPDDSDLQAALREERVNRASLKEEKTNYDNLLFSRAIFFIRESGKEMDERVIKARNFFENGRMSDANKVLDIKEMIEKDTQDAKMFEEARQARIKNIQAFTTKAEIVMLDDAIAIQERFSQASEAYEYAIRIAREIHFDGLIGVIYSYATHLLYFDKKDDAEKWFLELIKLPSDALFNKLLENPSEEDFNGYMCVGMSYYNLAAIHLLKRKFTTAEVEALKSIDLFNKIIELGADDAKIFYAMSLSVISQIHYAMLRYRDAEAESLEALNILYKMEDMGSHISLCLGIICNIYKDLNEFAKAEEKAKEAVAINSKRLDKFNKTNVDCDELLPYLDSLLVLMSIQKEMNKFDDAEQEYIKALDVIQILVKENPDRFEFMFGLTLTLGGELHTLIPPKILQAEKEFRQAFEIFKRHSYHYNCATTLNNLANLYSITGQTAVAEQAYNEVLNYFNSINDKDSEENINRRDIARTLHSLGRLYLNTNRLDKARETIEKAIAIFQLLMKINPGTYEYDLAQCLSTLGTVNARSNFFDEAEKNYISALEIYRSLANKSHDKYDNQLAIALYNLARFYGQINRADEAEKLDRERLQINRKLSLKKPEIFEAALAGNLSDLGHNNLNNFQEAEQFYAESLLIYRKLFNKEPNKNAMPLAASLYNLAYLYFLHNVRLDESVIFLNEMRTILDKLEKNINNQSLLAYALDILGQIYLKSNKQDEAVAMFDQLINIRRLLADQNPNVYKPVLANTLYTVANIYYQNNLRLDVAEDNYREALKIFNSLSEKYPGQYDMVVSQLQNRLADLQNTKN